MNFNLCFSDLSRRYNVERHTISKYYKNGGKIIKKRKNQKSVYDDFCDEIIQLLSQPGVSKVAAYQFLCGKYSDTFHQNYNSFKSYTLRKYIIPTKTKIVPHPRFETNPGEQLQVDLKETYFYTATLVYSIFHLFIYSKTTEDFIRCTIETLKKLGGLPKHILSDNMSTVVSIKNGTKDKNYKIVQFEKDLGMKIKLCKARSPETKGKDESSNKFVSCLLPYDNKFNDEKELIDIINKVNQQINRTTNIPPVTLFKKEKEYLSLIPNSLLLDSYVEVMLTQVILPTLLVNFKGS